jgi:dolichyl-phosphate beta-glucosyltransferase
MKLPLTLSVVVPVYNEEQRLHKTFAALRDFYSQNIFSAMDVIFVDDGSRDSTKNLIEKADLPMPFRIISYQPNRGKGRAVAVGMNASTMDYALMCDADISTSFNEMRKFIPALERGEDVIIGTRKSKEARMLKPQPFIRRNLGRCYTILADLMTGLSVSDFTCGFKLFSRRSRAAIFKKAIIDRWSYDTEILYLAHKYGFKIVEVPVDWTNDENTRVRLYKDAVKSFIDIIRIRLHRYN